MRIETQGTFWFRNDRLRTFTGKILGERRLIIEGKTPSDSYYINQLTKENHSIVIQGLLNEGKKISIIGSLTSISSSNSIRSYFSKIEFELEYIFYDEHFESEDVRLNGIMVNFSNMNKWITRSNIISNSRSSVGKELIINIDNAYSLKFQCPDLIYDAFKFNKDVLIRIDSIKGDHNFKELLEKKDVIQGFLPKL